MYMAKRHHSVHRWNMLEPWSQNGSFETFETPVTNPFNETEGSAMSAVLLSAFQEPGFQAIPFRMDCQLSTRKFHEILWKF